MKPSVNYTIFSGFLIFCFICLNASAQKSNYSEQHPVAIFSFDNNTLSSNDQMLRLETTMNSVFTDGLYGKCLTISEQNIGSQYVLNDFPLKFDQTEDFSIQFWVKTTVSNEKRTVLLSTKEMNDNSLSSQKRSGWMLGISSGVLWWNVGSDKRRLTYERDNGDKIPLNDNIWHQITMTYSSGKNQIRLYTDGTNKAIYNLQDGNGFEFSSNLPLILGYKNQKKTTKEILVSIKKGALQLQKLVNAYNNLNLKPLDPNELEDLIVNPKVFVAKKTTEGDDLNQKKEMPIDSIMKIRSQLMKNPYTVHQARTFLEVAPLLNLYSLKNGRIVIDNDLAEFYTSREKIEEANISIDEFKIWDKVLDAKEVRSSYKAYYSSKKPEQIRNKKEFTIAVWNIFHGGIHFNKTDHGWDSRKRIATMLKKEQADIILMQETYSSGDYIAAELGYYFATTADWDYLNQGSNISVLSRFPIEDIFIPEGASFMNVAAKISVNGRKMYAMSNWYGMQQFQNVFNFHRIRFEHSDEFPVVFGGDFNAVPHIDGGKSPASFKLLSSGFHDAFRVQFPHVEQYPGYTHRSGSRIDQLYFKGKNLKHLSTEVISNHPEGFPSDHYLIISKFEWK